MHQAVLAGHGAVVRFLVERGGARLEMKDTIYQGTPLGWAIYARQTEIEKCLRDPGQSLSGSDDAEIRKTVQDELNRDRGQQ
jgi:hypothetical protein